ncbi:MAG: chromosomal replication initiator protein DnaA [bacterium]|nr:chromosomal replication initiator protein DnaA [bacterium]
MEIWDQVLKKIEPKIPHESFLTWFGPLKCLKLDEGILQIGVPNQFFYEFLETHYRKHIHSALSELSNGDFSLQFQILQDGDVPEKPAEATPIAPFIPRNNNYDERTQLNPRYTFDNFVEGDGNSFAKASALAVAEGPGKTPFNPLFIYGATGLGKTHLIQAVGNFSLLHNKSLRVIYVTSEKFMNDFIFSIKAYKTTDFSRFYRTVDLLLLDDIQFFQGKERTQMEFFHTFNSLYQMGKQIVLSSDRPPKELDDFDKRLISRIGWGLVTDIQPPDYETRLAILQKRSDMEGIYLPEEVADFLARYFVDNIRELESALIRLVAHSSITGTDLTLQLTQEIFKNQIRTTSVSISVEMILQKVAEFYKIPLDSLLAHNRKKEIVWARQVAMYLCTILTNASLESIGVHIGNRDHSTVIHARNLVAKKTASNQDIFGEIESIKANISTH